MNQERHHFDRSTQVGREDLDNWFAQNRALWRELIEDSGVDQTHVDKLTEVLTTLQTSGWSHGDERGDYTHALLRRWANYINTVNPAIFDYDNELKKQAHLGIKPNETLLTSEELTLLTLYQQLRQDVSSSITRKTT